MGYLGDAGSGGTSGVNLGYQILGEDGGRFRKISVSSSAGSRSRLRFDPSLQPRWHLHLLLLRRRIRNRRLKGRLVLVLELVRVSFCRIWFFFSDEWR